MAWNLMYYKHLNLKTFDMKNFTIAVLLTALLLAGCNRKADELNQRNAELMSVIDQRDSIINELNVTLDEIEKNLGVVSTQEGQRDLRERLQRNISHINNLIERNQSRYDSLRRVIGTGSARSSNMARRIDTLTNELTVRENRINDLNDQIAQLNRRINEQDMTIGNLRGFSSEQSGTIDQMTRRINTAYFIVGEEKDLLNKNVIYKDGGFLGIFGRVKRLNPEFNNSLFTRIDIRDEKLIEVRKDNGKEKINIVTVHPPESYQIKELNEEVTQVEITDPLTFWEASKYLVVMKE
jgi:outer membrane murein-binding lipoprotein Lpp